MKKYKITEIEFPADESSTVEAYDAEAAAENYAENWDCGDYVLMKGGSLALTVEDCKSRVKINFLVEVEAEAVYYATRIEEGEQA